MNLQTELSECTSTTILMAARPAIENSKKMKTMEM